jgi:sugar lactone lactonase YvrE
VSDKTIAPPTDAPAQSVKHRRARRALTLGLVILVLLLGLSLYLLYSAVRVPMTTASDGKPVDTRGVKWVRSIYGTSVRPQDLFGQTQVAVPGADGTIWVTDVKRMSSVTKFSPDGSYLGSLTSLSPTMPISSPSRIAIGPDQRVYICETTLDRIHVLWPDGRDGGTFSVPQPVSVAVSEDRIAVGSVSGFAVLDKTGKILGVNGTRGKGPDQFDYVHGIAFGPDGSIYVSDSYNNRLSAYEPDGKRRWIIRTGAPANSAELKNDMLSSKLPSDTVLSGTDALQLPLGLTVDGAGRVVVIDMYDCTMAVFEPKTGKFIAKYGDVGAEDGQFFYPVSVGYDSGKDWFTVADALNRRVQIVRIPGSSAGAGRISAAVGRAAAGPLRACIFPLLLLLIAVAAFVVAHFVRRRRAGRENDEFVSGEAAAPDPGLE